MKYISQCFVLCLLLITSSVSARVSNDTFSLEHIAKIQYVSQAVISPDGEHIAYIKSVPRKLYKDKDGKSFSQLHIVNRKGESRPFLAGQVNISQLKWSTDNSQVYFLAKLKKDKFTSLYAMPTNGGEAVKQVSLKKASISQYDLNHNGKKVAILAKEPKEKENKELVKLGFKAEIYEEDLQFKQLFVATLNSNKKPKKQKIQGNISSVSFSPVDNKLLVKLQPSPLIDDIYMKSLWHIFDTKTQLILTTFETVGKLGKATFSTDAKYIALIGSIDINDPKEGQLYIADTKTGDIKNVSPTTSGHVKDIVWANQSNKLFYVLYTDVETEINYFDVSKKKHKTIANRSGFIINKISISKSDKTLAAVINTPSHPNEVYILKGKNHKLVRVTHTNPWLTDMPLAKQEVITYQARDGLKLHGILINPINKQSDKRYPLIMSIHGGPESHISNGWLTSYSKPGQIAASQDYAVFYPNYRGSTGRGVEFSKLGQNDYAGKEFDDIVDAKNHLVNIGLVNDKKVGITGGSYGGYASAWAATKQTKHFAASVMSVGVTDLISKYGTTDIANEMYLVHARSNPWDKWLWYLERSPIYYASQSETPLLIMHGKDDPRVHPSQSMELYRYMKSQDKTVRLVYYPGEGHGNKKTAARYDFSLRLMRWMDHYLKSDNTEKPPFYLDHASKLKK